MKQRFFILLIALLAIVTGARAQKDPIVIPGTLELELYSGEVLPEAGIKALALFANKANLTVKPDGQGGGIFYKGKTELFSIKVKDKQGKVTVPTDVTWKHNLDPVDVTRAELRELGITVAYDKISVVFSVTINSTNFTDETFRTYISENFDTNLKNKGRLTKAEAEAVKEIAVSEKGIASLKGVEYFTKLEKLNCYNNQLTELDVSKNTALTTLWCYGNQIKELDVSYNIELTDLECNVNPMTELDVSNNTKLSILFCGIKQLETLDLSNNTELTYLNCEGASLTELNLSKNSKLERLDCLGCKFTSIDVSGTLLENLMVDDKQLITLKASGCTALIHLNCPSLSIKEIDLSGCTALRDLTCINNQLTSLDVSGCTALKYLFCSNNQLTTFSVSDCSALEYLYCEDNKLTTLDVSKNIALKLLDCHQNQIRGAEMTALVESLPGDITDAEMRVYQEPDGNLMTPQQVAVATGKGWKVKNHDGSNWVDYLGESVPADANGDGEVTAADVETISDYILGRLAPDSWFDEESADVVDDGVVDIQDLTQLIQLLTE